MTDALPDGELPRFSRPIGLLDPEVAPSTGSRDGIPGVLAPFSGVLDPSWAAEGRTPAALTYLARHPLVVEPRPDANGIDSRTGERDRATTGPGGAERLAVATRDRRRDREPGTAARGPSAGVDREPDRRPPSPVRVTATAPGAASWAASETASRPRPFAVPNAASAAGPAAASVDGATVTAAPHPARPPRLVHRAWLPARNPTAPGDGGTGRSGRARAADAAWTVLSPAPVRDAPRGGGADERRDPAGGRPARARPPRRRPATGPPERRRQGATRATARTSPGAGAVGTVVWPRIEPTVSTPTSVPGPEPGTAPDPADSGDEAVRRVGHAPRPAPPPGRRLAVHRERFPSPSSSRSPAPPTVLVGPLDDGDRPRSRGTRSGLGPGSVAGRTVRSVTARTTVRRERSVETRSEQDGDANRHDGPAPGREVPRGRQSRGAGRAGRGDRPAGSTAARSPRLTMLEEPGPAADGTPGAPGGRPAASGASDGRAGGTRRSSASTADGPEAGARSPGSGGESTETGETGRQSTDAGAGRALDVDRFVDRFYREFERKMRVERERRGR